MGATPVGARLFAQLDEPAQTRVAEALRQLEHGHPSLGAERGLGHLPAAAGLADQVVVGNEDVVEEHLGEVGVAGGLGGGPNVDARPAHVH